MTAFLWGTVIVAALACAFTARRMVKLQRELDQLKRDQYYQSCRLKRIPEEIHGALQSVRLHLATVASGGAVPRDMILSGRLYREISPQDALRVWEEEAARDPERVVFLDVRTAKEYDARRVPGAKLVPFDELDQRYKDAVPEGADKVLVYCSAGERSRFVCDFLSQRGYTNLYHVNGGLQGWQGPTEGAPPASLVQIERKVASPR